MTRNLAPGLLLIILLASVGQARAQSDAMHRAYAAVEQRTLAEYEFNMAGITRQMLSSGASPGRLAPIRERMKMLSYNRAVLFAQCAAEAEKDRMPSAEPIPPERNLMLTTCVEIKLGELQKYSQLAAYADFFFPERIETCAEQSRLPELEKVLAPYPLLQIDKPRLFDFARYNKCLMTR
jgi:hypothetical protein